MESIDELRDFLSYCRDNHEFYDWLYQETDIEGIEDLDDFRNEVPSTSKEKMLEFYTDGNFDFGSDDLDKAVLGRPTSGTTSDMACYYRTQEEMESHCERFVEAADHFFEGGEGKDRVMVATTFSLLPIMVNQFMEKGCMVTGGSPFDLERTAKTVEVMNINTLVVSPSIALKISEKLKEAGYDGIEKYYLISSGLSSPTEEKLKELYPEADLMMQYGLAETGILMKQCAELAGTNSYHRFGEDSPFHYEFITEEGKEAEPGEIGEITVTKLNRETPLIRYQVGDLFERRGTCDCGEPIYKFIGRKEDKFKIQGVTVFSERIENALNPVNHLINQYQVIIDEEDGEDEMPLPMIRLKVEMDEEGDELEKEIEETFAENFQVAQDYNWAQGVEMGIFAPVEVESTSFEERKFRKVKDVRYRD